MVLMESDTAKASMTKFWQNKVFGKKVEFDDFWRSNQILRYKVYRQKIWDLL